MLRIRPLPNLISLATLVVTGLLFVAALVVFSACDTPKSSSPSVNNADLIPSPPPDYQSPQVRTLEDESTRTVQASKLPADSIPVSYSVKGAAMAPDDFMPMMGTWQSTYDAGEVVHFLPGRYVSYYEGEQIVEEKMTYYHVCPETCTGNEGLEQPCFVLASDYDQQCFSILNHTPDRLELSLVSGDGTRLVYQRMVQH